jgi:hypothetical protein
MKKSNEIYVKRRQYDPLIDLDIRKQFVKSMDNDINMCLGGITDLDEFVLEHGEVLQIKYEQSIKPVVLTERTLKKFNKMKEDINAFYRFAKRVMDSKAA